MSNIGSIPPNYSMSLNSPQVTAEMISSEGIQKYEPIRKPRGWALGISKKPKKNYGKFNEEGRAKQVTNSVTNIYEENIALKSDLKMEDLFLRNFWKTQLAWRGNQETITSEGKIKCKKLTKEEKQAQTEFRGKLRTSINEKRYSESSQLIEQNIEFFPQKYKGYAYLDILLLNMREKKWKCVTSFQIKLDGIFERIKNIIMAEAFYHLGDYQNSYHSFLNETDIISSNLLNYYQFANVCSYLGHWKEAIDHFNKLADKNLETIDLRLSYSDPKKDNSHLKTEIRLKLEACNINWDAEINGLETIPMGGETVEIENQNGMTIKPHLSALEDFIDAI